MEFLFFAAILGFIPAVIASGKGRSFLAWWIYGAAIFIVALPHSLMLKKDPTAIESRQVSEGMKKCPNCAEMVKSEARICRYCNRDLGGAPTGTAIKAGRTDQNTAIGSSRAAKRCPRCAEDVKREALVCRFCGYEFGSQPGDLVAPDANSHEDSEVTDLNEHAPDANSYEGSEVIDINEHAFGVKWGKTLEGTVVYREKDSTGWAKYNPSTTPLVPPSGYRS